MEDICYVDPGGTPVKQSNYKPFRIKLCSSCNRCWEYGYLLSGRKVVTWRDNFPKYGLEKVECESCVQKVKLKKKKEENSLKIKRSKRHASENMFESKLPEE